MRHILPELPFPKDSLSPHMSTETLEYHYDKHHRGYVEKLNRLIEGTEFEHLSLEEVVAKSTGEIFNNAAQSWNHGFFWNCLTPERSMPSTTMLGVLEEEFGSFDEFMELFKKTALGFFGAGWIWVVQNQKDKKLGIETTINANSPMRDGKKPILVCDLWEHAYYIDYRNNRSKYLAAYFSVLNWDFASENLISPAPTGLLGRPGIPGLSKMDRGFLKKKRIAQA